MRLSELARRIGAARWVGREDPDVLGIAYDSRRVKPRDLFVCVRGFQRDGREFLPDAVARGAVAAMVEEEALPGVRPLPAVVVPSPRIGMARAATALADYPSRALALVGVTGTNGKTTTTYLVESILRAAGWKTGVLGTIGCRIGTKMVPVGHTTPEAPDLQALLRQMVEAEVRAASMEVSSHALALGRTLGCEFDVGVFTNLTQDHLDFHPDLEDYFQSKARLFTEYPRDSEKPFTAVINWDDPFGVRLAEQSRGGVTTYGTGERAGLRATAVTAAPARIEYTLTGEGTSHRVRLPIGGLFNVSNSLAAIGAARALGIEWEAILDGLAGAVGVPGRFEPVAEGQPFSVIVDYAHSPDGLENVLASARALAPRRLAVVFGCGGDRDRTKRPLMGGIGARLADRVYLTSDNPRSEEPEAILRDIQAGIALEQRSRTSVEPDRRAAIFAAVAEAGEGDIVVIAGKGHETYQIFPTGTVHFDDREVAREAIRARQSSQETRNA
jgi:UDP-N-acetylmuramoyl-L-alanyl-D-glutamate--2,6-diaminopimelate ligase